MAASPVSPIPQDERYRALFDAVDVGFCIFQIILDDKGKPVDYRFLTYNPAFERHTGLVDAVGKTAREMVPDLDESWFRIYGNVALTGESIRFENHAPAMQRWFEVHAVRIGAPEALLVGLVFNNITERKNTQEALREREIQLRAAEERERNHLVDIFMHAPAFMAVVRGPRHIFEMANMPYYKLIGKQNLFETQGIIGKPIVEVIPEIKEQGFIALLDQVYRTGEAYVGSDTLVMIQREPDAPPEELVVDFTYQPLRDEKGNISSILMHGIDLTERKRLEQAGEHLLAAVRVQAEYEAILNHIGEAIRGNLPPDAILERTLALLGEGLGADRCYFTRSIRATGIATLYPEWVRQDSGLESFSGRTFAISEYSVNRSSNYRARRPHILSDVSASADEDAVPILSLGIRALVSIPVEEGDEYSNLTVAMANHPREWTREEVRLIENVAILLRAALKDAYAQQRERNIAVQLQEALLPDVPTDTEALAISSYYRPALAEAGVGGDFFDVFPTKPGCTAFIVADLSGKGLAAAREVATVRNMLRLALYSTETVAEAVTVLHRAIVAHDLLTSFCTLFVGVHDRSERILSYVNCGQEPGLIYRAATGEIYQMGPTGPVLGVIGTGPYLENIVSLHEGDTFALFTDGLTEVGPTRRTMLEIDGVSKLFQSCCRSTINSHPTAIVNCLINEIDAAALGGARDDIALLVVTVRDSSR